MFNIDEINAESRRITGEEDLLKIIEGKDKMKQMKVGDKVYIECFTSMGSGSNGYEEVTGIDERYDEMTGKKFPIYEVNTRWYDGRDGSCHSHPEFMFAIHLEDYQPKPHKILQEDKDFLWGLMPEWVKEVPEGLEPTFYGTLSYEGDKEVNETVKKLLNHVK